MARFRSGFALIGALTIAVAACGGGSDPKTGPLNMVGAARVRAAAVRRYGSQVEVGAARCPGSVPIQEHLSFVCTVEIDGAPLVYVVRQTDDQGHSQWRQAQAVIPTKKMEDLVKAGARKQGKVAKTVVCGEAALLIRNPGARPTCLVEFANGTRGVATLLVHDALPTVGFIGIKRSPG